MNSTSEGTQTGITPVGTVLGPGSTGLQLGDREHEIALLVAYGRTYKRISRELGISTANVGEAVSRIADRIPGEGSPRQRVAAWMYVYGSAEATSG